MITLKKHIINITQPRIKNKQKIFLLKNGQLFVKSLEIVRTYSPQFVVKADSHYACTTFGKNDLVN